MRSDLPARAVVPRRALPVANRAVAVPGSPDIIVNADSAATELVAMLIPMPLGLPARLVRFTVTELVKRGDFWW